MIKFNEALPTKGDLLKNPYLFAKFITEKFCGDEWSLKKLSEVDKELLYDILNILNEGRINYRQLNEVLLLLNQDTISADYFKFFFGKENIDLDKLLEGIKKIRGYSLLRFGNFRYPYKTFKRSSQTELEEIYKDYIQKTKEKILYYIDRPKKMLEIERIKKENAWCLGYLSGRIVNTEGGELKRQLELAENGHSLLLKTELSELLDGISFLSRNIEKIQIIGLKNTDKYLTWDYIDVYVATSMRHSWEFEEINEFINEVFSNPELDELNLRYFDPTQSFCSNSRDKGLIEGLMLKRGKCTIYLAQESDTMGKDSELAATLAQGKPVIAYVPKHKPKEYAKKIRGYPLTYFKKRFLILNAEIGFDDPNVINILEKYGEKSEDIIQNFLDSYGDYRQTQPFTLFSRKDQKFKEKYEEFDIVCEILAEVECYNFEKRATTLRGIHPLSMQIVLETGVANGVLVVRNADECAILLKKILTNDIEFEIVDEEMGENPLGIKESYTLLKEKISESPYRVVTHQERLTNSFWNNFWRTT